MASVYQSSLNESLDESSLDPPPFPSFTQTEVASLLSSEPRFGEQQPHGVAYAKDDYVVFRTRTVSIKDLGFRFEIFAESESKWIRVGSAFTLPGKFAESTGTTSVPILALNQMPIGEVNVEFLVVRALTEVEAAVRDDMRATFAHYWRKRPTLEIGHRGMGCSYTKTAAARENTVHSLREAAKRGADYVEFDVQVTKDKKVLLFHDFQVVVHVANRELNGQIAKHEVAVKDLSLEQLKLLHFEHCHALKEAHERGIMSIVPSADEAVRLASGAKEANPFPLLSEALESIDQDVGFNIEIKYPQPFKDGTHECANFWERNVYVDFILDVVFEHAKERRILFSSFDADVCTMINQKQNRYPVLFLIEGPTKRYTLYVDKRTSQTRLSVNFALADRILGLNFHSEELMEDTSELERAVGLGLVCFAWGDDLNQPEVVERLKKTLPMDGLIYDRIGEEVKRSNVFVVEKETKSALFGVASPAPSRRASDDLQTAVVRSPPSRMLSVNQARSPRK